MKGVFDMADAFGKAFSGIATGGFSVDATVASEVD
jgi:Trk-type K+ transport system membrane component